MGKGLGSSAAALTAGVVIADAMLGLRWSRGRVLDEAARIEGHPDNVAACVHGSIVASATDARDVTHAARLELHPRFGIAVVVPDFLLPTVEARRVLPKTYSRADVIFNIQRSALLITALATGITDAFPTALEDRLHQPYRAALVPGLDEIIGLRMKGLLGCALSGAGPSILVFYERGYEHVCQSVQHVFTAHGKDSEVMLDGVGDARLRTKLKIRCPHQSPGSARKARIFCSTPTIRWIGIPGAKRRSKKRARRQADLFVGGLFDLPLVPRDGARIV